MFKFFKLRHQKYYSQNRWHLIVDIIALLVIIMLIASIISFRLYRPLNEVNTAHSLILREAPAIVDFSVMNKTMKLSEELSLKISCQALAGQDLESVIIKLIPGEDGFVFEPDRLVINSCEEEEKSEKEFVSFLKPLKDGPLSKIVWQAQIEYLNTGQKIYQETRSLPEIIIAPDVKAYAAVYYNSPQGDQLGLGPLPPQLGLPTNYWVNFQASGLMPGMNDFILSARLAKNVTYTENKSLLAGDLSYIASSRRVIWKISKFSAEMTPQAGFEIQLVPTEAQVGKSPVLLEDIKYSFVDSASNLESEGQLDALTSNLEFDKINKGQGEVVQ